MREFRDKELRKTVVNMGYALTEATINYYRGEIRRTNRAALGWINSIFREKWSRAFEAMNSVLKPTRNLHITALVKSTFYRLGSLFGKRGHDLTKMFASGQTFTENCNKGMTDETSKSSSHNVIQFDRERFCFMVAESFNQHDDQPLCTFSVDLKRGWCDCGRFQAFHLPCFHVNAACAGIR
ncbi:unnamed protein product [Lathyrus sativus]|nr:unnamed protein product [Lathyrus sativus]